MQEKIYQKDKSEIPNSIHLKLSDKGDIDFRVESDTSKPTSLLYRLGIKITKAVMWMFKLNKWDL